MTDKRLEGGRQLKRKRDRSQIDGQREKYKENEKEIEDRQTVREIFEGVSGRKDSQNDKEIKHRLNVKGRNIVEMKKRQKTDRRSEGKIQ